MKQYCNILAIPNSIPLAPFSYLSSEQKCLRRSVSSAVWDGIRPDFSIYPPPAPSSTSPTLPNRLLPFHDDRKPSGAWRTPSQLTLARGNFLSKMWRLWFKCTSKEVWSFPRLAFSNADKDNDCEVSEPLNVRQSLSSGLLLQRTWKRD